ncbi:MAG: hypothetical protein V4466_06100 [Pseudomonadota bacterium]
MIAGVLSVAAVGATLLAVVPTDILEPAFRNTIVSVYPDGKTTKLWLNRDGHYEAIRANGQRTGGDWRLKDGKVCMTQKRPFFVPLAFCTVIPPGKGGVGVSWMAKGLKGEPVRHTIAAGR